MGRPIGECLSDAVRLYGVGNFGEAEAACLEALSDDKNDPVATHLLGLTRGQVGRQDEGLELIRKSIRLAPDRADFHTNHAFALGMMGRHAAALSAAGEAVRLEARSATAHLNHGVALDKTGNWDGAVLAYRTSVELDPRMPRAVLHYGIALKSVGRPAEAAPVLEEAAGLDATNPEPLRHLAGIAADFGDVPEMTRLQRRTVAMPGSTPADHSNQVVGSHYDPAQTPEMLFSEALNWAGRHAGPGDPAGHRFENSPVPGRRLRVGYLSSDFREHPAGRLIEPVLAFHDPTRVEVFCYADVPPGGSDLLTLRLGGLAHEWREVFGLPDAALVDRIREDRIDVLVELNGHFGNHRLCALARRAAPVQVSHFGYCDTTGLKTIDYRITDALSDPPGLTDRFHTERLCRISGSSWCYRPWGRHTGPGAGSFGSPGSRDFWQLQQPGQIERRRGQGLGGNSSSRARVQASAPGGPRVRSGH